MGTVAALSRSLTFWVVILLAIAVALGVLGMLLADEFDPWGEIGKSGIELGVVVLGGAALTTIITARQTERENQRQETEAFRLSLLHELTEAYDGLKEARRTLRAAGFQAPSGTLTAEQVEDFTEQMRSLSELQLALEGSVRMIQGRPDVLANAEALIPHLRRLEKYVNGLIQEWEQNNAAIARDRDGSRVANLHALQGFLAPAGTPDGFKENVSEPVALLIREIQGLRPSSRKRVGRR